MEIPWGEGWRGGGGIKGKLIAEKYKAKQEFGCFLELHVLTAAASTTVEPCLMVTSLLQPLFSPAKHHTVSHQKTHLMPVTVTL